MMPSSYQNIITLVDYKLQQRPRGFEYLVKELLSMFCRAFDADTTTVYASGYAFPMELIWAFDVVPFDLEIACNNLPQVIVGSGSSLMTPAENDGYSRSICSFHRLIIGCLVQDILPRADLYLTSSYYCHGKAKVNEIVADHFEGESILFDVPHEISDSSIKYVAGQLRSIAARLEDVSGQKLDMDRLQEAIGSSNRARSSLVQMNELMKAGPAPYDGVKACLLGLAGAMFWGSPIREEIHRLIIDEIKERIEAGTARPESHRVLWYPWVPVQTTNFFKILKANQVSVVMVEAARVWWSELDEDNPFEALALKALQNHHVGTSDGRIEALQNIAEEYDVDGVIHFSTPACYHENASFRLVSDALRARGIPLLDLEADMSDERNYSPSKTETKLNAFVELLQARTSG
ncbi:MAG: 2-hydroxyacyl-CoA dehydratase family protein [Proteobacteria bacterium]|nr:2-hydroxyacyl-CoA dehydratase family protein [Pseudomonadota bacterium]